MPVLSRLQSLKEKHSEIEKELHGEGCRPHGDVIRMARLKREKLRIKDEIFALECEITPMCEAAASG